MANGRLEKSLGDGVVENGGDAITFKWEQI
jgi:hypothetical protein